MRVTTNSVSAALLLATILLPIEIGIAAENKIETGIVPLPENPYAWDASRSCGPRCVGFLSSYFGRDTGYDEISILCPPGPFGTSLEQVRSSCESLGLHTLAIEITADDVRHLKHPAVLHLEKEGQGGHFAVVLGWDEEDQTFLVYSPPEFLGTVDMDWMRSRMSGLAVVVSDTSLNPDSSVLSAPNETFTDWQLSGVTLVMLAVVALWKRGGKLKNGQGLVFFMALSLAGCNYSEPETQTGSDPVSIKRQPVENPYNVDVGRVIDGKIITHTYHVVNELTEPFRVTHVHRSCSCQDVVYDSSRIVQKGDDIAVEVNIPTAGREGPYRQEFHVEVETTSGAKERITLSLLADIEARIKAIPTSLMFGTIGPGESPTQRLTVKTNMASLSEQLTDIKVEGNPYISTSLSEQTAGLLAFDVSVSPDMPFGDLYGRIKMRFNDAEVPELTVPILGRKSGAARAIPGKLRLSSSTLQKRRVKILSNDSRPVEISDVNAPPGIRVEWDKDELSVSVADLEDAASPETRMPFSLTVVLQHPEQTQITVPCVWEDVK